MVNNEHTAPSYNLHSVSFLKVSDDVLCMCVYTFVCEPLCANTDAFDPFEMSSTGTL